MNNVNLVGRLAKDPDTRTAGRTNIIMIIVATERVKLDENGKTYKENGYTAKETEFHKVTCFNGTGRAVREHRAKGDLVAIEGRLHYSR